jgi:3'-5' exoribonuclease 1
LKSVQLNKNNQQKNSDKMGLNNSNETEVVMCYDYIGVVDFEATCIESSQFNKYPNEIIEFPIVLVNARTLQIEDTFSLYCKPTINPKLSEFCTKLTGITQHTVDKAEEFPVVLEKVNDWLTSKQLIGPNKKYEFALATDGPWDMQHFLDLQCHHSGIEYPYWAKEWINIRKMFANWYGTRPCGISKMLSYFELQFEGNEHCGKVFFQMIRNLNLINLFICFFKRSGRFKEHCENFN